MLVHNITFFRLKSSIPLEYLASLGTPQAPEKIPEMLPGLKNQKNLIFGTGILNHCSLPWGGEGVDFLGVVPGRVPWGRAMGTCANFRRKNSTIVEGYLKIPSKSHFPKSAQNSIQPTTPLSKEAR